MRQTLGGGAGTAVQPPGSERSGRHTVGIRTPPSQRVSLTSLDSLSSRAVPSSLPAPPPHTHTSVSSSSSSKMDYDSVMGSKSHTRLSHGSHHLAERGTGGGAAGGGGESRVPCLARLPAGLTGHSVFPALRPVPGQGRRSGRVRGWMNEPDLCQSIIIYKALSHPLTPGLFLGSLPCPPRGSAQKCMVMRSLLIING